MDYFNLNSSDRIEHLLSIMSAPEKNTMERGTAIMNTHLSSCQLMEIRQTRRGWLQECFGCEAKSEFKYFIDNKQVADSLEESAFCCRCFCQPCYGWKMQVKDLDTKSEILEVERPWQFAVGSCKCCCYQQATIVSGGHRLGRIEETCFFCVPSFKTYDDQGKHTYTIHPPTCCCGVCVNCFTEGNPCCGRGCCKVPFWIFPSTQSQTDGSVNYVGKILKKPKSIMTEVFTEANAFEVHFPTDATVSDKAVLVGSTIFFNSVFFEKSQD